MEMERHSTVCVATGALGSVLNTLTVLNTVTVLIESHLGAAGTSSDMESIISMLASLHSLLLRIWERDDLGAECKEWMTEARALSYDMEEDIDDLILRLERGDRVGHRGMNKLYWNLKRRVEAISRRCREEWKTASAPDEAISISNKRSKPSPADPRARFLHKDVSELVGMDRPFLKLHRLLEDHEMVCIHGFAGTSKTTLADMVYRKIGDEFDCRAFILLSKSPDMLEVLGDLLTQVTEGVHSVETSCAQATTEENLIHQISKFLSSKRYLVIVDDIWLWQSLEIVRRALPKGNRLCRIIATTRVHAIAEKCCLTEEDATIYWHSGIDAQDGYELSQKIEDPSRMRWNNHRINDTIRYVCGGMTLAIRCLTSAAVANIDYKRWRHSNDGQLLLQKLWHMLLDGFLCNNPELKPMVECLRLGYDDLPVHAKTCLLYCTIFPTGSKIEKHGLVRKWITQGFFPKGPEQEKKEAAAEACLDELVSRDLLQEKQTASTSYFTVHPMMRAFLLWRSKEANFATCLDLPPHDTPPSYASAPMPFIGFGARKDTVSAKDVSRARCLVVLHSTDIDRCIFPWQQLKRVRVLSIESESLGQPYDIDLMAICSQMTHLRYLGLKGRPFSALPQQIGSLQSLETLDVSQSFVQEVPKEIGKLHRMKILNVCNTSVRELPRDIGNLHRLKTLDVSNTSVQELPWLSSSSVTVLVGSDKAAVKLSDGVLAVMQAWKSQTISPWDLNPGKDLCIMLYDHLGCLLPVLGLKLRSRHMMGVPEWVKQHLANESYLDVRLCKLNQDDLDFLCNQMANLQLLTLRLEVLPRKPIVITGAGFSSLKSFCLDCRLPLVTFQQGAMPKLEHIEFRFYASRAFVSEHPVGIRHLLSLRRMVFHSSRYSSNAPGISAVINKVREEAKEHRNRITISINDKDEEVTQEKKVATTMTTSASDKISEENIVTSGGAGGISGASMIKTRPPFTYDNGSDDDEKGRIIPVKSYYPFGVTE